MIPNPIPEEILTARLGNLAIPTEGEMEEIREFPNRRLETFTTQTCGDCGRVVNRVISEHILVEKEVDKEMPWICEACQKRRNRQR